MRECPECDGELDREDCIFCGGWGHIRQGVGAMSGTIACGNCDEGKVEVCLDCGYVVSEEVSK